MEQKPEEEKQKSFIDKANNFIPQVIPGRPFPKIIAIKSLGTFFAANGWLLGIIALIVVIFLFTLGIVLPMGTSFTQPDNNPTQAAEPIVTPPPAL